MIYLSIYCFFFLIFTKGIRIISLIFNLYLYETRFLLTLIFPLRNKEYILVFGKLLINLNKKLSIRWLTLFILILIKFKKKIIHFNIINNFIKIKYIKTRIIMKKILINATEKEELRIAIIKKKKLYNLTIENKKCIKKRLNIYKGKISRIEPSLDAVFINYGEKKHGFLPFKEIHKEYLINKLYKGQELIVQINREERNKKGASLTTFISIIKSNIILMPNNPKLIGISKKILGEEKKKIKLILQKLNISKKIGLIIRTNCANKTLETIKYELNSSIKKWKKIKDKSNKKNAPFLLWRENNIITRTLRDYLNENIKEIIIDNKKILKKIIKKIKNIKKNNFIKKIKLYKKKIPLFSYYNIEKQIELAYKRKITLKSGISIIIDITEAITTIDINSAKYKKQNNIESTALNTNIKAIKEIARQLRIRNIGGLIVIDLIDMSNKENKKIVEKKFKKYLKYDKAKINIGHISKFGLLEMSRQRINTSLKESSYYVCSKCEGSGNIRNIESLSLSILRLIEEKIYKKKTKEIHIIVSIKIFNYLITKKKKNIYKIRKKYENKIKILIIPNKNIKITNYYIIKFIKKKNNNLIKKNTNLNIYNNKNNILLIENKNKNNNINNNNIYTYTNKIINYIKYYFYKFKQFNIFKNRISYKNKDNENI